MTHSNLIEALQNIVGADGVVDDPDALMVYNSDGLCMETHPPDVVVLPTKTDQVAAIVQLARQMGIPCVPRGAGTGLSGGATPIKGGIVISFSRMDKLLDVFPADRQALVQPGVINLELSEALKPWHAHFAPDPASQKACTIGGCIAYNSGGPHCLKYGVTSHHTIALEVVLHDGTVFWTGDGVLEATGYDLSGLLVGSEGTLGLITCARVRITALPETNRVVMALFASMVSACEAVSAVIAAGYLPTSLEMIDKHLIRAVNKVYHLGLPETAAAGLIIEIDGVAEGIDDLLQEIMTVCQQHNAVEIRPAVGADEQAQVWAARKNALGAIGRLAPAYYLADTVVPRTRLPHMIEEVERLSAEYALPIMNVFHAGDGNLHPFVLYDPKDADQTQRALAITSEVIKRSLEQGGVISGEHGIGLEKRRYMPLMFSIPDMQAMAAIYALFNPENLLNPSKIFPAHMPPLELAAQRQARIASTQGRASKDDLAVALEHIVGADGMLTGDAITNAYTIQGYTPRSVVFPKHIEEVAAIMAACHAAGATVVPWGGGTQQNQGYVHAAPDVVLVMRHIDTVVAYTPDDLTITVGAGMTLRALQATLAEYRQMLPMDAPLPEQVTLGGLLATAADSPYRTGYGTLRDRVLGMTIVEVDGTIIRTGGQVVKNVSGYDLARLFYGSHGTLGIIASVSLNVYPCPRTTRSLLLTFSRRSDTMAMLEDLAATDLTPSAVEYLNHDALQRIGFAGGCGLAIRMEGADVACKRHMSEIHNLAIHYKPIEVHVLDDDAQERLWGNIAHFLATHDVAEDEMVLRLAVLPGDTRTAIAHVEDYAVKHELACACLGRTACGIIYARVRGSQDELCVMQDNLVARWGHSHVLACNPTYKDTLHLWGLLPAHMHVMQSLKAIFDPANTLNPKRYVV